LTIHVQGRWHKMSASAHHLITCRTGKEYGKKNRWVKKIVLMCDADAWNKPRKHMKMAQESSLEDAVLKWYVQQRSCCVNVWGLEFKYAANMLANHVKISFKASDGWLLWYFKLDGIMNKRTYGKALGALVERMEPFRQNWWLKFFKVWNPQHGWDWFVLALPETTQAYRHEMSIPGRKISEERILALFYANADGSCRLMPITGGRSRCSRVLKDCMKELPVIL
jgi:hypothetical protein